MRGRKVRLNIAIPDYPEKGAIKGGHPGMAWRREVYQNIMQAATDQRVEKYEGVDLECEVIVYLSHTKMQLHDVDNLQKHIFDALQGKFGGFKGGKRRWALLPNDHQIRRVVVEKRERRSKKEQSRLIIRDFAKISRYRKAHPSRPTHHVRFRSGY